LSALQNNHFFRSLNPAQIESGADRNLSLRTLIGRLNEICEAAERAGVSVYIDAEHYDTQPAFDAITELLMNSFNHRRAVVYHTLQMYLRDRPAYLQSLIQRARERNYHPGIKLVR